MMHPFRKAAPVWFAAVLVSLLLGSAGATMMTWRPPAVKQITEGPTKAAVVGKTTTIECTIGAAGDVQLDTNSAQGKYLALERKPSWTVPVEIRVNGKTVGQFDDAGMASPSSTLKHQATWTPVAAEAGKPAVIECTVDPVKKLFYSSKSIPVTVLLKVNVMKRNQPPPNMKALPHPILPVPPGGRK